jgi:hypothetical protein
MIKKYFFRAGNKLLRPGGLLLGVQTVALDTETRPGGCVEQSVADGSEGAAVAVASSPEFGIFGSAAGVVLHGDGRQ